MAMILSTHLNGMLSDDAPYSSHEQIKYISIDKFKCREKKKNTNVDGKKMPKAPKLIETTTKQKPTT